jgi:hypothetical protein
MTPTISSSTNPETRHVILSTHIHAHAVNTHVVVVQSAIAFVTRHVTCPVQSASACVTPGVVYSVILMYSHVMIYPFMQVQLRIFGRVLLRVCITPPAPPFWPTYIGEHIENLGNVLGTWLELIGNLKGTCWEQRKNEKNPLPMGVKSPCRVAKMSSHFDQIFSQSVLVFVTNNFGSDQNTIKVQFYYSSILLKCFGDGFISN